MHTALMVSRAPVINNRSASLSTTFNPLCSKMDQELHKKFLSNQSSHYKNTNGVSALVKGAVPINHYLKSEAFIMLCCQLCSTRYTSVHSTTNQELF